MHYGLNTEHDVTGIIDAPPKKFTPQSGQLCWLTMKCDSKNEQIEIDSGISKCDSVDDIAHDRG